MRVHRYTHTSHHSTRRRFCVCRRCRCRHVNGCVTGVDYIRLAQSTAATAPERTFIIFSQIKWTNIIRQPNVVLGPSSRAERKRTFKRLQFLPQDDAHVRCAYRIPCVLRVFYVLRPAVMSTYRIVFVCVHFNEVLCVLFCLCGASMHFAARK